MPLIRPLNYHTKWQAFVEAQHNRFMDRAERIVDKSAKSDSILYCISVKGDPPEAADSSIFAAWLELFTYDF